MPERRKSMSQPHAETFGDMLRYLRKRAQLTQRELAIAVGYSEAHISRLERSERLPDLSTLAALFIPALGLQDEPQTIAQLLEFAATARGDARNFHGELTLVESTEKKVTQLLDVLPVFSNLPLQLTSFIGREREIEEIKSLLLGETKVRLLTLFGAGGCGKTRLAVQVAEQLILEYPDGVWFVDLAPLRDQQVIFRTVAIILGLPEFPGQEATETLVAFLRPR